MIVTPAHVEALALLEDLATRSEWVGFVLAENPGPTGNQEKYSIEARRLAFHYAIENSRCADTAYSWRGMLLFAARDLRKIVEGGSP